MLEKTKRIIKLIELFALYTPGVVRELPDLIQKDILYSSRIPPQKKKSLFCLSLSSPHWNHVCSVEDNSTYRHLI